MFLSSLGHTMTCFLSSLDFYQTKILYINKVKAHYAAIQITLKGEICIFFSKKSVSISSYLILTFLSVITGGIRTNYDFHDNCQTFGALQEKCKK